MSTIKVNAIQNTSGVEQYLAKAWVNFNGTGTVAIKASGNVSSITDNGVGDYTINFTNAMVDANYAVALNNVAKASNDVYGIFLVAGTNYVPVLKSTTKLRTYCGAAYGTGMLDVPELSVTIFR
jgi:hypothetical protein